MLSSIYIKRESDKKSGRKTKKNAPQEEKKMWFESTKGLNLKEGGKAKGKEKNRQWAIDNSQWGYFPYSLLAIP